MGAFPFKTAYTESDTSSMQWLEWYGTKSLKNINLYEFKARDVNKPNRLSFAWMGLSLSPACCLMSQAQARVSLSEAC